MFGIHFIEFVMLAGDVNVYKSRTSCQAINFSPLYVFPIVEPSFAFSVRFNFDIVDKRKLNFDKRHAKY